MLLALSPLIGASRRSRPLMPVYMAPSCLAAPSVRAVLLRAAACCCCFCLPRTMSLPQVFRFPAVPGSDPHKRNDLLLVRGNGPHHVLYFPGDVQSYEELMVSHPDNRKWKQWSFESTAAVLSRRFPNSHIWVVRSSRMHLHKFSCYDNFVASNLFGAPQLSTDFGAFKHLRALLSNAFTLAQNVVSSQKRTSCPKDTQSPSISSVLPVYTKNGCPTENENHFGIDFGSPSVKDSLSFTLIGFSKGCVVLNQLLYELKAAQKDPNMEPFISNIKSMYWLDGGHSGGSNTWVTAREILSEFSHTGIEVHVHVTPYQVSDSMRSWIGKEHKLFVQILQDYGMPVSSLLHFADQAPSLNNHFRVHEVF